MSSQLVHALLLQNETSVTLNLGRICDSMGLEQSSGIIRGRDQPYLNGTCTVPSVMSPLYSQNKIPVPHHNNATRTQTSMETVWEAHGTVGIPQSAGIKTAQTNWIKVCICFERWFEFFHQFWCGNSMGTAPSWQPMPPRNGDTSGAGENMRLLRVFRVVRVARLLRDLVQRNEGGVGGGVGGDMKKFVKWINIKS